VGVLLYRKHVISELPYIPQLVQHMESQQLTPLPLFITGVDGHIAVRDSLTSVFETEQVARGEIKRNPTLSRDAVNVDAVVSTIGFPLVGGPAGSMEGARQADLASINRSPPPFPRPCAPRVQFLSCENTCCTGPCGLNARNARRRLM
jgi:magnesium chelatase subunit H